MLIPLRVFRAFRPIASCVLVATCTEATPRSDLGDERVLAMAVERPQCLGASLRPSSAPPADGVWISGPDADGKRIAAYVAPPEIRASSTRLTRVIETRESSIGGVDVRNHLDTAVVHLDLLPPYHDGEIVSVAGDDDSGRMGQPTAVYALSSTVLLAAYDGCSGLQPPAIRYLRRDARGGIVTDAMLRRQPTTR